jgi:hypothetical protein
MAQTWFTVVGILLLGGAFGLQILYLMSQENSDADKTKSTEEFQVPAGIMNLLVVVYLMSTMMFYRPYSNKYVVVGSIFFLIAGLMGEIYLTVYLTQLPDAISSYLVLALNVLFRLYLLVDIHCESPLTTVPGLLSQITQPIVEAARPVGKELEKMDMNNIYQKVLGSLGALREGKSLEQWTETKDRLKEALGIPPRERQQAGRRR